MKNARISWKSKLFSICKKTHIPFHLQKFCIFLAIAWTCMLKQEKRMWNACMISTKNCAFFLPLSNMLKQEKCTRNAWFLPAKILHFPCTWANTIMQEIRTRNAWLLNAKILQFPCVWVHMLANCKRNAWLLPAKIVPFPCLRVTCLCKKNAQEMHDFVL